MAYTMEQLANLDVDSLFADEQQKCCACNKKIDLNEFPNPTLDRSSNKRRRPLYAESCNMADKFKR